MTARMLDGKSAAAEIRHEIALQIRDWPMPKPPGLTVLRSETMPSALSTCATRSWLARTVRSPGSSRLFLAMSAQ